MPDNPSALGFKSADQNLRYFIDFLDARRSIVGERDVKNLILELLELHAGRHVLDVGCGAGDDAREMAGMVAPAGRVVGIDPSEGMIKEAKARAGSSPILEFRVGDVGKLNFPDNSFDAVRTDRVLTFVSEVERAISEIHRVLRPGGCVVTSEIDHGTHLVDSPYPETSRKLFDAFAGSMPQRHLGRELPRLLTAAGFRRIRLIPRVIQPPLDVWERGWAGFIPESIAKGIVSADEAARWFEALREQTRRELM